MGADRRAVGESTRAGRGLRGRVARSVEHRPRPRPAPGHPGVAQSRQIAELFTEMCTGAAPENRRLQAELRQHSEAAADAYRHLGEVLREEIAPRARQADACGRDAYRLMSRLFLGTSVDLDEAYEWGLGLLDAVVAEQESIAQQLYPGATVAETLRRLDQEPRYVVSGTDAPAGMDAATLRSRG